MISTSKPVLVSAGGLASSLYDISSPAPGFLRIDGKGSGHGVGLSQRSARDLAALGWDFVRILRFYYAGAAPCGLAGATAGVKGCAGAL